MHCQLCLNLQAAFDALQTAYVQAGASASDQVSKKFAAYLRVEMERAKMELEEHNLDCPAVANAMQQSPAFSPASATPRAGSPRSPNRAASREGSHEGVRERSKILSIQSAA